MVTPSVVRVYRKSGGACTSPMVPRSVTTVDWVAVLVVLGFLALIAVGFVFRARDQQLRADRRVGEAAVEIDGLFAPARKHTVEYFHSQRMYREDVASPDGDGFRIVIRDDE
jgi:hypothetical protein